MTRNEMLNQFLILGAALLKEPSNGDIHFEEQQAIVRDEILLNPMFATPMTMLYKNNIVFNGEQGPIPTIKGWKSIQPRVQTKVVKQMTTKPVEKMTDKELLDNFVDTSITICDRMPRSKSLQKQSIVSYDALFDAVTCVASTLNNNVSVVEAVVEETEVAVEPTIDKETKPVKKANKKLSKPAGAIFPVFDDVSYEAQS